jgi:hypothetical protein
MLQRKNVVTGHRWLAAIAIGTAVAGLTVSSCRAQCVELSERTPQIDLDAFSKEPASLLQRLRNDKEKLAGRLTGYLVTDPGLLPAVRTLIGEAANADRPAIGTALRRAESRCVTTKPQAARKINEFVQKLGDLAVLSGYSAAADEPEAPSRAAKSPSHGAGLMSGEWKTELADPFAPMPLPQ